MGDNSATVDDTMLPRAFIHMYFEVDTVDVDVDNFIRNEQNYESILNYLSGIQLKYMVGDATADTFKYVMPQFRYVCDRDYHLQIVKFDAGKVYLKKGSVVYATNLFVQNPSAAMDYLLRVPAVGEYFLNRTESAAVGGKFYMWNGEEGVVVARPYLDWMGMKICNGAPHTENKWYRVYLLGETVAKLFIEGKFDGTQIPDAVLKNYHKGTPLVRAVNNERHVISEKVFTTNNYDVVFDAFEQEFKTKIRNIHFVQRDYIYDATFPEDLAELLQKQYISPTSIYKKVNRFVVNNLYDLTNKLVIDRYTVNKFRKMLVNDNYALPTQALENYIFAPNHIFQVRHTLNAAFVPKLGLVILAQHMFFGARRVLNFEPNEDLATFIKTKVEVHDDDVFYHVGGSYFLEETSFVSNGAPIYIVVRVDDNLIVRHNLIRSSRKLRDLKNNWVYNTILSLFVRKY
ncbi:ORF15 P49 [Cydia pomonella granulovirus]|uniref:ORF15 P49 n=2 Tax=Cydia pomonella granulosis virus TaxID=28289 RepID=Q91F31_GVCPM|nr:ORF15 P49 [Cydia pomonella granulovirus]AAK70682.1 ORF15 P49 [Cydia pomonella granulovirus]AIU36804.1 ORF15 p49 [Cydia pomonella granulovirus]AIU36941.1 ORF15 p49 [Cydia pomonella granulovirus]AIU37083.1 ORF15 p49 [Cydia pomonella granulovirus]QDW81076.1 p49 [Cydia pomonella granulovirus]